MLSTSRTSPWARVKGVGPQPHGHELDLGVVVTRQFDKAAVVEVAAAEPLGTSEGQKGDEHAGPPRRPTAFGHDRLFGGGERYPLELARALALVDGVRCELVTFGREARVEEHDGLLVHVLRAVGHLGGHSAHLVAPVTPGDELVLMWVEREHRLAVGLPDTGVDVSERVGERPVERLDAIVERHPDRSRHGTRAVPSRR